MGRAKVGPGGKRRAACKWTKDAGGAKERHTGGPRAALPDVGSRDNPLEGEHIPRYRHAGIWYARDPEGASTELRDWGPVKYQPTVDLWDAEAALMMAQTEAAAEPTTPEPAPEKPAKAPKAPKPEKPKRLSALDAAAIVLKNMGVAMGAKALVDAMAAANLWSSPGGKTPDATLSAAMMREIKTKGEASRFKKTAPGLFAATHEGA